MTTVNEQKKLFNKIQAGLELSYKRLVELKRKNNSELVVWRDGKIVKIKP